MIVDALLQDLRYTLRTFGRNPGLIAAAVACLALGIGANATIVGVVDTLLFRPPAHVADPARVVRLYFRTTSRVFGTSTGSVRPYPLFTAIGDSVRAFGEVAAFTGARATSIGRGPDARSAQVDLVSGSYFSLLGVKPALGRFYAPDEDHPGGPAVVVLAYGFWTREFGGDAGVLGRQLHLGRNVYTVIGVAPAGFSGVNLQPVDLWAPLAVATPDVIGGSWATAGSPWWLNRGASFVQIIGRLRPGATVPQAAQQATIVFRAENAMSGGENDPTAVALIGPVQRARGPEMSQDAKVSTWLAAVSVIILLIACANVANLLLARAIYRQREVAVRLVMGAGRGRLARQLLTESVVLGLAGGAGALLLTLWVEPLARALFLPNIPPSAVAVDGRNILFMAVVALFTGLLAGLAPALQASRADLTPALKSGTGEGRYRRSRLRTALLVGQVALTVVLIVGAGLFARSLHNVRGQDFGFDPERTLIVAVDLRSVGSRPAEINGTYVRTLERLQALPGVERAAVTVGHPFGPAIGSKVSLPGSDLALAPNAGAIYVQRVTSDYFAAMGTPVRGRAFTAADRGEPVAIVNETMARRLWPGESAIGKCIRSGDDTRCSEIVGIVPDARRFSAVEVPSMLYYVPFSGDSSSVVTALVVRTRGRPEDLIGTVRRAMQEAAANLPFTRVTPLTELLAPSIRPWRLGSAMFGVLAILAIVLSAVGLYGVIAYTVAQRTHEVGVRLAIGAQHWDVLRLIIGQGARVAALGAALGTVVALAGSRVLASLMFGISPRDPLVLLVAALTPVVVAAAASYIPAQRAAKVDASTALRYE